MLPYCETERGKTHLFRHFLHQPAIVQCPTPIKLTDPLYNPAVHGDECAARVHVRHNGPHKRIIHVRDIPCEDGYRGADIVEMNTHIHNHEALVLLCLLFVLRLLLVVMFVKAVCCVV